MIFDQHCKLGDGGFYKNSVVNFVKFDTYGLREMFAYLRQEEDILQKDFSRESDPASRLVLGARLHECQKNLIYMASNLHRGHRTQYLREIRVGEKPGQPATLSLPLEGLTGEFEGVEGE